MEFAVADVAAARQFYGEAFGWTFNDYGPGYAGILTPDGHEEMGGIGAAENAAASRPLVLIRSRDLDTALAAITAAGGDIVAGPYDYPGGRHFEFTDPNGTRLGVYQPQP